MVNKVSPIIKVMNILLFHHSEVRDS